MSEAVYTYEQDGVFTLKITGHNEGRYEAYCKRLDVAVESEASKIDIVTPNGTDRIKPPFYETRYFVRCDFKDKDISGAFVRHKMTSVSESFDFNGDTLVGTLDFVNSPGKFQFEIVWWKGENRESAVFEWMVVSEKMDVQKDYHEIVETIELHAPGLVRAFLAKAKGEAGLVCEGDTNEAIWADIFNEVGDRYRRACEWITNRPHLKYVSEVEYRRAGLVKRWGPSLVNAYASMDEGRRQIALLRTEHITPEIDTVENRFVKFTLKSITKRLEDFIKICKEHEKAVSKTFTDDLDLRRGKLVKLQNKAFFKNIGRFTGFRQESLAMQRKQGYADIYATWVMLQKTLDTTKQGFDTGHRPISALYEFWCFLRIADLIEKTFEYGQPKGLIERARVYDDLFEESDPEKIDTTTLSALTYEYQEKNGVRIKLLYQQNYGEKGSGGDLAFYNPQRPDIVLVIERDGETYTYLFDAKYRIDERAGVDASPSEPINDMHRYRDAILYRTQEGDEKLSRQVVGAYVLYPGRPGDKSFNYDELIRNENIGAIPLLPGDAGGKALEEFVGNILGKKTAQEHLGDDIPTRGTTVVVGEGFGESEILTIEEQPPNSFLEEVRSGFVYPVEKGSFDATRTYRQIKYVVSNQAVGLFNIDMSVPIKERTGAEMPRFKLPAGKTYCVFTLEAKTVEQAGVKPRPAV